jgi:hypothetical protein
MAQLDKMRREKTDMRPSAQWSHSIHHKRASTRDEAKGDVYDLLCQILELIDEVEEECGKGAMPCSDELGKAQKTYELLLKGD